MHPTETRNQFLKLRIQGWSFDRIGRHLGVSKPTLIAWSRRRASELSALHAAETKNLWRTLEIARQEALDRLTIKLRGVQQELLSRDLKSVPTSCLESMEAQLRQDVQKLEAVKKTSLESTPARQA